MPAFLLSPLIRWAVIGVVMAVLAGWAYTEHRLRIGADAERDAAKQAVDLASQDAKRWHNASDLRDGAIAGLTAKMQAQSDAITKLQFARDQADQIAAKAESDARDARAAFDQRIQEIENERQASPQDVRGLGPIVLRRVDKLFD